MLSRKVLCEEKGKEVIIQGERPYTHVLKAFGSQQLDEFRFFLCEELCYKGIDVPLKCAYRKLQ